jgi:phospholipase D1/2
MAKPKRARSWIGKTGSLTRNLLTGSARHAHSRHARPAWKKIVSLAIVLVGMFLAWRYTPLADLITVDRIKAWARAVGDASWSPLVVMAAYSPAVFLMFPRPLITLFAVIAYGPWLGFATAMSGDVVAALTTYYVGRALPRDTVRNIAGEKVAQKSKALRGHGVLPAFAASIAPVAPFVVVGMVAGAARIKLWQYLVGNALGMMPGTLASTVFADQVAAALEDPSTINYWVIAGIAVFFVVLIFGVRRWLAKMQG